MYFTEIIISQNFTGILRNKPIYLGISILALRKILIYGFCHNYIKSKYDEKGKNCVTWIQINTAYYKQMMLIKTSQKILKPD